MSTATSSGLRLPRHLAPSRARLRTLRRPAPELAVLLVLAAVLDLWALDRNGWANTYYSAAVLVNASTRFTDGGEFGFGAEIGISTQKLHARGPMGLPEMTSTKYVVTGDGHVR